VLAIGVYLTLVLMVRGPDRLALLLLSVYALGMPLTGLLLLALLAAIPNFLIGLLSALLARLNHRS
jgi:hypothetical protein